MSSPTSHPQSCSPRGAAGVFVLGMHRSGTSAAARLLNLAGVPLGRADDLMPAARDNERGFWESSRLTATNNALLEALGAHSVAPPQIPREWRAVPRYAVLETLVEQARAAFEAVYGEQELWAWKDPRTCVTLPFWLHVLNDVRPVCVLAWRNPLEVARSLGERDSFSKVEALALWERYTRAALANAAGLATFVAAYDELLADPCGWTARVRAFLLELGLPLDDAAPPDEALAFVDAGLRHSRFDLAALDSDPDVTGPQRALARTLAALAGAHDALPSVALPPESPAVSALLARKLRQVRPEPPVATAPRAAARVLVDAAEALASPGLLAGLAGAWSPGPPLSLVLYAPDGDPAELAPSLEAALRTAGLLDHPTVQPIALVVPSGDEHRIASSLAAVLGDTPPAPAFAALPRFGAAQAGALRELAARLGRAAA